MTEITQSKPKIGEPVVVLKHSSAAEQWATSEQRTIVFSVTREEPNPRAGQPIEGALIPEGVDGWIAPLEPDTIVVVHDYTMPSKPNAGLGLDYLKRARQQADVAMSWLIEVAIGSDGYDALTTELSGVDNADEAQRILQGVVERIQRVALGGLEAPKA